MAADMTKPPICAGECIRCGRIAKYWFCTTCTQPPVYVNRIPRKRLTLVSCNCGCGNDHTRVEWENVA